MMTKSDRGRRAPGAITVIENKLYYKSDCFEVKHTGEDTACFKLHKHRTNSELLGIRIFGLKLEIFKPLYSMCNSLCFSEQGSQQMTSALLTIQKQQQQKSFLGSQEDISNIKNNLFCEVNRTVSFSQKVEQYFWRAVSWKYQWKYFLGKCPESECALTDGVPCGFCRGSHSCRSECNSHA